MDEIVLGAAARPEGAFAQQPDLGREATVAPVVRRCHARRAEPGTPRGLRAVAHETTRQLGRGRAPGPRRAGQDRQWPDRGHRGVVDRRTRVDARRHVVPAGRVAGTGAAVGGPASRPVCGRSRSGNSRSRCCGRPGPAGSPATAVLGDAEFGESATLRRTLHRTQIAYALGVSSTLKIFLGTPRLVAPVPRAGLGRPRLRPTLRPTSRPSRSAPGPRRRRPAPGAWSRGATARNRRGVNHNEHQKWANHQGLFQWVSHA